jgi:hypothetical protein
MIKIGGVTKSFVVLACVGVVLIIVVGFIV